MVSVVGKFVAQLQPDMKLSSKPTVDVTAIPILTTSEDIDLDLIKSGSWDNVDSFCVDY